MISDKDIYKGKPNPFQDAAKGAETLLKLADQLIAKGKELSKVSIGKITSNQKQTTADLRAYQTEISKLSQTTKELTNVEKQRKVLQDQLRQSEDASVKAKIRYKEAVQTQRQEITQLVRWQNAEKSSVNRINAAYAILNKRYKKINQSTAEGARRAQAYKKALDANRKAAYKMADAEGKRFKSIGKYKNALKGLISSLGLFTSGALLAAQAIRKIISVTREAIRVNREFEKTFANVLTLLDKIEKAKFEEILAIGAVDLMARYGLEIADVNSALFDTISNGIEVGNAISFMDKSARLAIAGNAKLASVVKGATKVYAIYKDEVESVDEILNVFFAAQVEGATNVEFLANNIGKVSATAHKAGIPLNELFGTFAGLTKFLDGTEESATALVNIINALIKVSPQAQKEFEKLGIETGITAIKQNGLLNTIIQVTDALEGNEDIITKLIPNIRAFKGFAGLTAEAIAEIQQNIEELNDTQKSSTLLWEAFTEQMSTGQKQADTLKGSWQRLLITIGGGESVFKKIGSDIRSYFTNRIDLATFAVEMFAISWKNLTRQISADEAREQWDELNNRFSDTTEQIEDNTAATEKNVQAVKKRISVINEQLKSAKNAPKIPESKVIDWGTPFIPDDLDLDQGLSSQIDKEIDEISRKLDIIDGLYKTHYDGLIGLAFNYGNRKRAEDSELTADELESIIEGNAQKEQAVQNLANSLKSIFSSLLNSRLTQIQTEISAQNQSINELEQSINREHQLLLAGAANEYNTEKEKLRKLQAERNRNLEEKRKLQKKQEQIDTLTQISQLATAVATIINSAVSQLGWVGVVAGLAAAAAAIVGFTTYKSEAESAAYAEEGGTFTRKGTQIEKGKRHKDGGNKYTAAEFEQGEKTAVFSRNATNKYGALIDDFTFAANNGQLNSDQLEMYKYSLTKLNPNNVVINNNNAELLSEIRITNMLLQSQKTPFMTKKGHVALYDMFGQIKKVSN